jgi:hypothetical protein
VASPSTGPTVLEAGRVLIFSKTAASRSRLPVASHDDRYEMGQLPSRLKSLEPISTFRRRRTNEARHVRTLLGRFEFEFIVRPSQAGITRQAVR